MRKPSGRNLILINFSNRTAKCPKKGEGGLGCWWHRPKDAKRDWGEGGVEGKEKYRRNLKKKISSMMGTL